MAAEATAQNTSSPAEAIKQISVAIFAMVAAIAVRWLLTPILGANRPYLTVFAAVAVGVWFARWRAAAVIGLAGFFIAGRMFGHRGQPFAIDGFWAVESLGFSLSAGCIIAVGEVMHRTRERLEQVLMDQKRSELLEREQKDLLDVTLASIPDAVLTTDAEGRVSTMNAAAEALTDWPLSDALGRPVEAVFRIAQKSGPQAPVGNLDLAASRRRRRSGSTTSPTQRGALQTRRGREVPIELSASTIRDRDGVRRGEVFVFRDSTKRKQAEDERRALLESERAARTEAENAGRVKDEFLATLSHELRTPLSSILGWSRLIERNPTQAETVTKGVQVITRNAKVQADLISDLLDMSRITSGKLRLEVGDVDLSELVTAQVDSVKHSAEAKGILISCDVSPVLVTVRGDASRLQQVLWNLLSNAVKFTSPRGSVSVALETHGGLARIVVRDTGKGIRSEFVPHLFERFRQSDGSMARHFGGLGLGLAIVRHLVEAHGGTVRAESEGEGKGSTFTVLLPLAHDLPSACYDAAGPREMAELEGVEILAIDDQADTREFVARFLEERNARVIVAGSAEEGLRALELHRPAVVLCDIGMPGKDGYEFIREVRGRGDDTPAVAVTAFARPEDKAQALRAGFQGHLTKPIEPSELVATVAALIRPFAARSPAV